MMVNSKCALVFLLVFLASSEALPRPGPAREDNPDKMPGKKDGLFGLPFLEFTDGGVRVNFGGYHAEAGLGGLLGKSGPGGGLYAGAGTPFGAHASAGLGGAVNGENGGSTGGGLQARAGLGNGGPEAAAGLDGNLDGANPSRSGGRLWKSTSSGGKTRITTKTIGPDSTNIQAIPMNKNEHHLEIVERSAITKDSDAELVRREITVPDEKINAVEPLSSTVTHRPPLYAAPTRRCQRKRLCRGLQRKTVIQQQLPLAEAPVDFGRENIVPPAPQSIPTVSVHARALVGPQSASTGYHDVSVVPGPAPSLSTHQKSRTIFDDIFNIPISALTAVNQLLNNKAG